MSQIETPLTERDGGASRFSLDADAVRTAYARWAPVYDKVFGGVSSIGRRRAVEAVNRLPGRDVLEVGVGTGLALPYYDRSKRITGIDLSQEMLELARARVKRSNLQHVTALMEVDAEATGFESHSFDIAVAMYVASVVPHPRALMAEMQRVVRPGGPILFVSHFGAQRGPRRWVEDVLAPASRRLGWHPGFPLDSLLTPAQVASARFSSVPPFGLWTLVQLPN